MTYLVSPQEQILIDENTAAARQGVECDQGVARVNEVSVGIEEALDSVDDLHAVGGVMTLALDSKEGLSEQAAQMAEIAVEAICARVGLDMRTVRMPAMESFSTGADRLSATKLALEATENILVRIWKAILSALRASWKFVSGLFGSSTARVASSEKKIVAAEKRLEEIEKTPEPIRKEAAQKKAKDGDPLTRRRESFANSSLTSMFSIGGKADPDTVAEILKVQSVSMKFGRMCMAACKTYVESRGEQTDAEKFTAAVAGAAKAFGPAVASEDQSDAFLHGRAGAGKALSLVYSDGELNGIRFEHLPEDEADAIAAADKRQIKLITKLSYSAISDSTKYSNDLAAMKAIYDKAVKIAEQKIDTAAPGEAARALDEKWRMRPVVKVLNFVGAELTVSVVNAIAATASYINTCVANEDIVQP